MVLRCDIKAQETEEKVENWTSSNFQKENFCTSIITHVHLREMKTHIHIKTQTLIFIGTLFK